MNAFCFILICGYNQNTIWYLSILSNSDQDKFNRNWKLIILEFYAISIMSWISYLKIVKCNIGTVVYIVNTKYLGIYLAVFKVIYF